MESDEGLRTVECLRGRLLAERQASKTAKQDAELMENKFIELEKELKEETKLKNKTEKRLKLLRKKLEYLKLLPTSEESEHCAVSCVTSTSSSCTKNPESFEISFSKENSNSPGTTESDTKGSSHEKFSVKSSSGHEDTKVDDTSYSSLKDSTVDDDYVDNSLALVPLIIQETKLDPEIKMVSKSIGEVLDTLSHARERIQSSMRRRQMIRVGPSRVHAK